ncbi:MAG: FtsX-like permease family protein [Chloroflexota bacterium]|nr:FtsX-like permease family protein [Chloroflexota bacterium]
MIWISSLLWLLPRRLRSSWALLAITGFGVLASVTLMSLGAVYTRALAEAGLQHSIASTSRQILNTHIISQNRPLGPADYDKMRSTMEEIVENRLGFMIRDIQRYGRPQPEILLVKEPFQSSQLLGAPSARPFFLTDFQEHARLIDGKWPSPVPGDSDGRLSIEVAVGEDTASVMFWELGSEAVILPYRTDLEQQIHVKVVGLIEPIDPSEEYWMGFYDYFGPQEAGEIVLMPLYVPEELFFNGIGARFPTLVGDFGWYLYLDTDVLDADLVQPTREAFQGMESDINKNVPRSLILTRLENSRDTGLLASYQRAVTRARAPIYLFISLVVVVILYFLILVTGLLAKSRSEEAGLLRSRGASMLQVGTVITLAEAILVAAATLAGPLLALLIFRLALFGTIDPKGGTETLEVGLRADMFLLGAVGGLMSLAVLAAANFNLARIGLLDFLRERARPPTIPYLQRYYIDLLVVVALGLVWWQVEQRGSFLERTLTRGYSELDVSLLLAPSLALLTAAFLVLRVLPLAVRTLAWGARLAAPAWAAFALSRVARDPLPYGSLTVIVMLAAALGVFGASFQATLGRSQEDQALYRSGGELEVHIIAPTSDTEDNLASLPSVHTFTPVKREGVTLLDVDPGSSAVLLGVDPVALVDVAWFREDFSTSGKTLSELVTPLRRGQSRLPDLSGNLASGIAIPEDAESIGAWVSNKTFAESTVQQSLNLWLRVADSDGSYENLDLGTIQLSHGGLQRTDARGEWTYFEAPMPEEKVWLDPPFNVVALFFVGRSLYRMPPGSIYVDDISVKLKTPAAGSNPDAGGRQVIENFDDVGRWVALPHHGESPDSALVSRRAGRDEGWGMEFTWQDPLLQEPRGVFIPPGDFPLAAVGSPDLAGAQFLRADTGTQLVPFAVQETVSHFPTILRREQSFLLVSLKSFEDYTRRLPRGIPTPPREYWLALEEGEDRAQAIRSVREATSVSANIRDRAGLVERYAQDPLAGGGWNGLTLLGLGALTLVVTLALSTHAIVAVNGSRVELTVTRALGFSRSQLLGLLVLERLLVAAVGLAAGAIIGYYLGRWTLGYLGITPGGLPIVPPMVLTVQTWLVTLVIVNLAIAAALSIIVAAVAVGRLKPSDILRNRG